MHRQHHDGSIPVSKLSASCSPRIEHPKRMTAATVTHVALYG